MARTGRAMRARVVRAMRAVRAVRAVRTVRAVRARRAVRAVRARRAAMAARAVRAVRARATIIAVPLFQSQSCRFLTIHHTREYPRTPTAITPTITLPQKTNGGIAAIHATYAEITSHNPTFFDVLQLFFNQHRRSGASFGMSSAVILINPLNNNRCIPAFHN